MQTWRRGAVLRLLIVLPCVLASASCRHDAAAPARLMDGSPAAAPKVDIETIRDAAIATKVEAVAVSELADSSAAAMCLNLVGVDAGPGAVVTRVGVNGESVTFRAALRRSLYSCDNSTGPREGGDRWCGGAYGRLESERLTDPRLDLTCTTATGEPVAFAWIEPSADARFVAVRQPGYVEVYEVAAHLPVRVTTTTDLAVEESSASFEISEHDARGALLRTYTLSARVAG
jgi:hypothetical protein